MKGLSTTSRNGKRVGCGTGRGWSDADLAELNFLRAKGLSAKQIAACMDIKPQRVNDKIKQIRDGYRLPSQAPARRCLGCSRVFPSDRFRMCPDCRRAA